VANERKPLCLISVEEIALMSLAEKITALLEGFTRYQIEGLRPIARRQLANACQRVLQDCNRVDAQPKPDRIQRTIDGAREAAEPAGVLARLASGERSQ
jgi:hypothetical protein